MFGTPSNYSSSNGVVTTVIVYDFLVGLNLAQTFDYSIYLVNH